MPFPDEAALEKAEDTNAQFYRRGGVADSMSFVLDDLEWCGAMLGDPLKVPDVLSQLSYTFQDAHVNKHFFFNAGMSTPEAIAALFTGTWRLLASRLSLDKHLGVMGAHELVEEFVAEPTEVDEESLTDFLRRAAAAVVEARDLEAEAAQ